MMATQLMQERSKWTECSRNAASGQNVPGTQQVDRMFQERSKWTECSRNAASGQNEEPAL